MERTPLANRLADWLMPRILPNLLVWVLVAIIAEVLSLNFAQAAWVPDSSTFTQAVTWSTLLGIALAGSRFRGRLVAGYHVLMAPLLIGLWIGHILPPLAQILARPALDTLDLANIRLLTFTDRVSSWAGALAAGNAVPDNGLFQLIIALILWGVCAWLTWAVIRRQRTLEGLLPVGLALGINTYLSNQSVDALWLVLCCAVGLAPRTALMALYRSWDHRQVDYPDDLGISWTGAALGLGMVVLLLARLSPLVGTPEGWKALGDTFRQAQKQLETTTTRLFSDVAPPPPHPEDLNVTREPPAPFAETPQMGLIGLAPSQSDEVVMWVKTSDPPPPQQHPGQPEIPVEPGPIHYWRADIFGRYTGSGWEGLAFGAAPASGQAGLPAPPPGSEARQPGQPAPTIPGHYLLNQSFDIPAHHGADLFASSQPAAAAGGAELRYAGPDGTPLVTGAGATHSYSVQSWVPQVSDVLLRAAPASYPAELSAAYLQLPSSLPQRVRDLARRVVGDAPTPFDKAVRVQDYLRKSYKYDLAVPPPPTGQDVVDYFLFDSPGGFCSYYSSAMAVMLRSVGVPARVASGYNTGVYDFSRGAYRVTPSNAHAWTEVYFPGTGWVEFEPTAAIDRIDYETPAGQADAQNAPLPERPIPPMPAWQVDLLVGLAIAAPVGLFVLVFRLQARRRRQLAIQPPELTAEQDYLRLRRLLRWAGLTAPASATPDEFLRANRPALQGYGALPDVLTEATALYQQAVYSPRPPTRSEIFRARRMSAGDWWMWARLLVKSIGRK